MLRLPALRVVSVCAAATFVVAAATTVRARGVTTTTRRDPVYAGLVGHWQGTVQVRDRRDTTRRVTLSTKVRVRPTPGSDALEMHFTTSNRTGGEWIDTDRLLFDTSMTAAQWGAMADSWPQHFDVQVLDPRASTVTSPALPLRLVLEAEGSIDDSPATIRQTMTMRPGEIRIVQETRTDGGSFEFQREYVLRRIAG